MIVLILFFGLLFRLIDLNQSLWWDEGITFTAVSKYNLFELITKFPLGDFHPPFYYVLLMYWTKIFGYSEVALRAPSVLLGVVLILLVYLIGKKIFNTKIGLTSGLLVATSPLLIYYSQEARMYMLDVVLVSISMYLFVLLIESDFKSLLTKAGFIVVNVLILYSDYIIYLIFPVQLVFLLLFKRLLLSRYLYLLIIVGVFLLPWIPVLMVQMDNGRQVREALPVWANIVGGTTFKEVGLLFAKTIFGRITFENKMLYAGIVLVGSVVYGLLVSLNFKNRNPFIYMLLMWLCLPVILALLVSLYTPVFSYFRMIFILPALYLLVSRGVLFLPKIGTIFFVVFICLANVYFAYIYYLTPRFQRENWRSAIKYTYNYKERNSLILFENNTIPDVFQYYKVGSVKALPGLKNIPANSLDDTIDQKDLEGVKRVLLFEYLVEITDKNRLLEKKLYNLGFRTGGSAGSIGTGTINIFQR